MKKVLSLFVVTALLLTVGLVSAQMVLPGEGPDPTLGDDLPGCTSQTVVGGTIYQNVVENGIVGANVQVTCNNVIKEATSGTNGAYSVNFDCSECTYEDLVTVHAYKDGLTGDNSGAVDMTYEIPCGIRLDIGIVNVPLVPEFGVIVGIVTALGALGVFFIVRRK